MSTAVTVVGGRQVIRLHRPLVVGIRVEGTIACAGAHNAAVLKPRPYLRYLAETLHRLQCPVALFSSADPRNETTLWGRFAARDFPVRFDKVYDPDARGCNGGQRARGLAVCDFTSYLHRVAAQAATTPSRILFLDCELNYRFSPMQTLVLERYEFLTWRQERQRCGAASSLLQGRNTPAARARQARQAYEHRLREAVESVERQTQGLVAEQRLTAREGSSSNNITPVDRIGLQSAVLRRRAEAVAQEQGRAWRASLIGKAPLAVGSVDLVAANDALQTVSETKKKRALPPTRAAAETPPALRRNDHSLVAVAEMIAELAASEQGVTAFLHEQPLVEQLRVPNFDDAAYYLASESCEHVVPLDWSAIEVQAGEAEAT